jgi:NAD-dependent deacetylase
MKTIQDLVNHMNNFKDAVVIIGPRALDGLKKPVPTSEELKESYTKKVLRREPDKFWEFFSDKIFVNPYDESVIKTHDAVCYLQNKGAVKDIIDLNTDGLLRYEQGPIENYIQLHGSNLTFTCQKKECNTLFTHDYVFNPDGAIVNKRCEVCGAPLRPNGLLLGENYNDDNYNALKFLLLSTHTLVLVGLDYTEEPILDLIASFGDMKVMSKQTGNPEDVKVMVTIQPDDIAFDIADIAFSEYVVKDDCGVALTRLMGAFKK